MGRNITKKNKQKNVSPIGSNVVVGHLPVYNKRIDPRRTYRKRIAQNVARYSFIPISYRVNWSQLGDGKVDGKVFEIQRERPLQKFKTTQIVNSISNVADSITIIATGDATHAESINNTYGYGKVMSMLNDIRQNGKVQILKELSDLSSLGGGASYTDDIREKTVHAGGSTFETILSSAMGLQLSLPKVWNKSAYSNSITITVKLVAPSGSPNDVYKFVVTPLKYLLLLASPTTNNGLVSGYPYLFEVTSAGNAYLKAGVVTSFSINRGGADNVFNIYGQPTSLDIRLTVSDVFEHFAVAYDKVIGQTTGTSTLSDMEYSLMNSGSVTRSST